MKWYIVKDLLKSFFDTAYYFAPISKIDENFNVDYVTVFECNKEDWIFRISSDLDIKKIDKNNSDTWVLYISDKDYESLKFGYSLYCSENGIKQ